MGTDVHTRLTLLQRSQCLRDKLARRHPMIDVLVTESGLKEIVCWPETCVQDRIGSQALLWIDISYTDRSMSFSLLSYIIFGELMHDQKLIKLVFDSTLGKDVKDSGGNTPLHHLLCEHPGDSLPEIIAERYSCYQFVLNNNNELPVHIACEGENLELIKAVSSQLQEKDINTQDSVHGNTPLHVMCKCCLFTC